MTSTRHAFAASFGQRRLWFLDQWEPGSSVYNVPVATRLTGPLDLDALERSLGAVVARHESLRTRFALHEGQPMQVIESEVVVPLRRLDLAALPSDRREVEGQRAVTEEAGRPFDLGEGPLIRALVVRLGADDHIMLVTLHHIVCDDWSIDVLLGELGRCYNACVAGHRPPLAPLDIQYGDYSEWQREWLQGAELDRQLSYWRQQLADVPVLQLQADHVRPTVMSSRGGEQPIGLSRGVTDKLTALGREERATLFMTLLAAFQTLLMRYTGQIDFAVGSPIAGRNRVEIEPLIGFFVNTLVLRTDLGGDPTFRELLQRVRAVTLDAYTHQDIPFEKLVEELRPERATTHAPLCQAMFVLQNGPQKTPGLQGTTAAAYAIERSTSKFEVTLSMRDAPGGLTGGLEYNTDLFEPATVARMAAHFERLLESICANPDTHLSALPMLSEGERHQILVDWNKTGAPYPRDLAVTQVFEAQADRSPDAVAIVSGAERITYAGLNGLSNQLARLLRRQGIRRGERVALCLERSIDMIAAVLGVLKAGAAYVPLDPGDPPERLRLMIEDAGVAALIAHRNTASRLPAVDHARVFVLDGERDNLARESAANLEDHPAAEDMAYVMYTSGSTGAPKAVTIAHRGIVRLVRGVSYVSLTPDDVVLQAAPLSFDASTFEIWGALLNGGTLSQVPIEKPSLAELGDVLERNRVTVAWFTSGLFSQMVEHELDRLCRVRQVLAGGDVLSVPHVRRFVHAATASTLINGYGPTENTTFTCCHRISHDQHIGSTVPIGRPISNSEVYVLDPHLNPQPVGVPGELYAGGDGIAIGYWNRPELTAERFLPHPFRSDPASRVYRTGDRVRYRDDGTIEFLGRFDHQVKVRGYRVELGEIEAVLAQHPAVSEAVVTAEQDADGIKRLDAYVAARAAVSGPELRQDLRSRLPEYMLPSTITVLDALPKAASGKVDRRVLPTLQTRSLDPQLGTPRDSMEEELARLWCQVLNVKAVGIHDNFFDLGGHSLLSTTVIARIREHYGVELPLRALFDAPTIAALATRLKTGANDRDRRLIPLQPQESETPLFGVNASFGQRRLWFLDQWEPGSSVYNVPVATRLTGPLDLDALERSLGAVVARHESLRTRFALYEGQPMQVVESEVVVPLRRLDLAALPSDRREVEGQRAVAEEAGRPFDLGEGPLIRALVVRLGADDHIMLVTLHHIVCDGWSIDVLLGELGRCYNACVAGHRPPLAPLDIQYGDYSEWQREWLQGAELDRQLSYWRQQLADVPVLQLQADHVRPTVMSSRGGEQPIGLSRGVTDKLTALGREERATLFMTLLAAFQTLLMRYTGQIDFAVGSPIAGRNRVEIEPLIGFFVNTLVLRTDLGGDPTFRELLQRVRAVTLDAYTHQDIPFEKLVEELRPERATTHAPLCQAMFMLQNGPQKTPGLQGTTAAAYAIERSTSKFEVTLSLRGGPDGVTGSLEYATDLFEPATIARMASHFARLVESAVTMPDARLSELSLLAESERSQLLVDWNQTSAEYPARRLHQLVEDQAARTPHATAVVSGDDSLSYTALNARANQLARALRRSGIGPDVVVGVCLERSIDLAVALLAVLKAGGAYLPLDPSYPAPRFQAMVEDGRVALIVSDSALVDRVAHTTTAVLCVDRDRVAWTSEADDDLENAAADESLAYVLFTSGSTGRPKGVMVPHRAVCNYVEWMKSAFGFAADDRVLLRTPMSFDLSVWELFVPLTSGSTLVLAPPGNEFDPAAVASLIAEHGITVMQLVPSLLALLLDAPDLSRCQTLRRLFSGGAALTAALRDRFFDRFAHTALHNGYGPTETCINSVMWDCERGHVRSVVPIGRPIANTSVYVLGPNLEVQPIGAPGELYIGGAGVARGYINQPELTAERFIPNPFAAHVEERLYRTGDRVRYLADGNLEFLGRNDDQVKVRGVRIELQEVGAALASHPGVQQSVVVSRSDGSEDPQLVAYFVTEGAVAQRERAACLSPTDVARSHGSHVVRQA